MANPTRVAPRTNGAPAVPAKIADKLKGLNIASLTSGSVALSVIASLIGYGISKPLYDLKRAIASVIVGNDVDTAIGGYEDAKNLKNGEAMVSFSERFQTETLAVKDDGGVFFFGFLHDKDGNPKVEKVLVLCECVINRDFAIPDTDVVLKAGQTIFKALPVDYVERLMEAA